jgi:hypothetical protein
MSSCTFCKKNINQKYLKVGSYLFHPECFCCSHCKQKIDSQYNKKNGKFYHLNCYKQSQNLVCSHCNTFLNETWVNHENKKYHQQCYLKNYAPECNICGLAIGGEYTYDDEGKYHSHCFKNAKLPSCSVCTLPLEGKYLIDNWDNVAHINHNGYKTNLCHSCSRIISPKTSNGGVKYADNRYVCGICRITEVVSDDQINLSKQRVINQLHEAGFDYIPNYISVSLSDKNNLNKRLGVNLEQNSHGYTKTIVKKENKKVISTEHSIFILYGLPRLKFEGVLAHELIHVWLNERDIKMPKKDIEGFCNLGAALIYQKDGTANGNSYLKSMSEDSDPVYGDGYRKMSRKLQNLGWKSLINEVVNINNSVINKFSIFREKLL